MKNYDVSSKTSWKTMIFHRENMENHNCSMKHDDISSFFKKKNHLWSEIIGAQTKVTKTYCIHVLGTSKVTPRRQNISLDIRRKIRLKINVEKAILTRRLRSRSTNGGTNMMRFYVTCHWLILISILLSGMREPHAVRFWIYLFFVSLILWIVDVKDSRNNGQLFLLM